MAKENSLVRVVLIAVTGQSIGHESHGIITGLIELQMVRNMDIAIGFLQAPSSVFTAGRWNETPI